MEATMEATSMSIFQAIILGIVQGIAEFLPISSSGHLIVMQRVFGMQEPALTFDIVVHLGTLVAILIVFWSDVLALIKNPFSKMTGLLIVATLPAVIAGLLFRDLIENYLRSGIWLAAAFTVTGFLLVAADRFTKGVKEEKDISYVDALIIGCLQALALPPGISRSGTTITGALSRGINREAAAKFSFMMAIIAIAGAGTLEVFRLITRSDNICDTYETYGICCTLSEPAVGIGAMIFGFLAAAIVGYLSIKLLLKLIKACNLRYFSYYVWVLAALILLDYIVFNLFF
ncbi:MAG: undecaprenyl-diphosphate phosphatase [Defluviitaleaceae bacterium]|nr:undecaprenyl-diphosphate phosphatase [Defluviitaleaceae bacterium]